MSPRPSGRQPRPAVRRVADVQLRGPRGPVPARAYWPVARDRHVAPPLLVLFPGDGSAPDGLEGADALCRGLCSDLGVVVLSVSYRPATPSIDGADVADATAAVRWAADHAPQIGADPGHLLVAGAGMGGSIATAVARRAGDDGWPAIERQVRIPPQPAGAAADDRRRGAAGRRLPRLAHAARPRAEA
jgi:acetyl esterase/lipase